LLKTYSTVNKSGVNIGSRKAKLNEPVKKVHARFARGALSSDRVCAVSDKSSGKTRNDWTIRGDILEEVWHRMVLSPIIEALADDHNHHLSLYRTYFAPPPILSVWNKRHGAGMAPASGFAHQPSMGNDPPNPGEYKKPKKLEL